MVDTDRVTGAAKEFVGKAQGAVGDLTGSKSDSVEGRFREASGQAENLYGQAKDTVRHAADQASSYADDAADYAEDAYERGGHYLRRGTREVSHQVAEYPLASLLVAGLERHRHVAGRGCRQVEADRGGAFGKSHRATRGGALPLRNDDEGGHGTPGSGGRGARAVGILCSAGAQRRVMAVAGPVIRRVGGPSAGSRSMAAESW